MTLHWLALLSKRLTSEARYRIIRLNGFVPERFENILGMIVMTEHYKVLLLSVEKKR